MRLIRANTLRRAPWKNGGGETMELAVFPNGAGLDNFLWRISMAIVASDGPFSVFHGIDRTLTLLKGAGMNLAITGQPPKTFDAASAPLTFPADTPTIATLTDGPITDLNVMTRRGAFIHHVAKISLHGDTVIKADADAVLLLCREGEIDITLDGAHQTLEPLDSLLCDDARPVSWRITAQQPARLILVELRATPTAARANQYDQP